MKYVEFTVHTTDEAEELVSDVLWNYQEYGVSVSSVKDVIELTEKRRETYDYLEDGLLSGNLGISLVKSYFDVENAHEIKRLVLKDFDTLKLNSAGFINLGTLELVERIIDGDDWIEVWRKHYRPIDFGAITVCPLWVKCEAANNVVYLDSNAAFGTGEHETTAMCIKYLQKYIAANDVVVDCGTGTGILGIAAKKLGAKEVIMTDIDEVAVAAAKHNVEINNESAFYQVFNTNLLTGVEIVGDVVVANITADVLKILSQTIKGYVKKNGLIILSGILKDRLDEVVDHYCKLGFTFLESSVMGEWAAVCLKS